MDKILHRLPSSENEPPVPETKWFFRYKPFKQQETLRQVEFKRRKWPHLKDGQYSKKKSHYYPHILPSDFSFKNAFPPIRSSLKNYLNKNEIAIHSEAANLLSSQICCFNFLFPLKNNLDSARKLLSSVLPNGREIKTMEFEDTGTGDITEWLGEPKGGKRGQNRTSADASIRWLDSQRKERLTYIEWKYTEESFGHCGGYYSKGNNNKEKCRKFVVSQQLNQLENQCFLATRKNDRCCRKYWERILSSADGVSELILLEKLSASPGCPFIGPLNQLMRLELLAEHTRSKCNDFDSVDVVVIYFEGNESLFKPPKPLELLGTLVVDIWKSALRKQDNFRWVSVERMMEEFDNSPIEEMREWREYLKERYGV